MPFGVDPNIVSAYAAVGILVITIVFSAIAARYQYLALNPEPRLQVNRLPGGYELSVANPSAHPIHVSSVSFWQDGDAHLSADDFQPSEIASQTKLLIPLRLTAGQAPLSFGHLTVVWHKNGTASDPKSVSMTVWL